MNLTIIQLEFNRGTIPEILRFKDVFERNFYHNHLSKYETKCHIHNGKTIWKFNIFFPKIQDLFLSKFPLFFIKNFLPTKISSHPDWLHGSFLDTGKHSRTLMKMVTLHALISIIIWHIHTIKFLPIVHSHRLAT